VNSESPTAQAGAGHANVPDDVQWIAAFTVNDSPADADPFEPEEAQAVASPFYDSFLVFDSPLWDPFTHTPSPEHNPLVDSSVRPNRASPTFRGRNVPVRTVTPPKAPWSAADTLKRSQLASVAHAALLAGAIDAAKTVLCEGAVTAKDFYLLKNGVMTQQDFDHRLKVRCDNLPRELAVSAGGAILGSALLTPLVGSCLAPAVGSAIFSTVAALLIRNRDEL
jgi:hypothetical protein